MNDEQDMLGRWVASVPPPYMRARHGRWTCKTQPFCTDCDTWFEDEDGWAVHWLDVHAQEDE